MLPWAHAAVGYLCYSAWRRWRLGEPPAGPATIALGVGTQFPDLVDKTFTWTFGVLPSGRSLAHSLLVATVALGVLLALARLGGWAWRTELRAFGLGWVTHPLADGLDALVGGEWAELGYLVYPLAAPLEPSRDWSYLEFFRSLELTAWMAFGFLLTAVGLAVWWRDGRPGLREVAGLVGVEVSRS